MMTERRDVVFVVALVLAGCTAGRPRPEHTVVGSKLTLRGFELVPGTDVFRAALTEESSGLSSGYSTRNFLFVEPSGKARWLLPDNGHVLDEHTVVPPGASRDDQELPPVALVVLARPDAAEQKGGDVYLCDPAGRRVQRIADQVEEVRGVTLATGDVAILYERKGGYVISRYDLAAFTKSGEVSIQVPKLE